MDLTWTEKARPDRSPCLVHPTFVQQSYKWQKLESSQRSANSELLDGMQPGRQATVPVDSSLGRSFHSRWVDAQDWDRQVSRQEQ